MNDEKWLDVNGYEGLYMVSDYGNVKRKSGSRTSKPGKIMKLHVNNNGYVIIGLTKDGAQKPMLVHRLVACAFIGDCPDGYQCNHINGVRSDNRASNLEWVSASDNLKHSFRVLHRKRSNGVRLGPDHHNAKLCSDDVPRIREMLDGGVSMREIGRTFNVHWSTIREIRDNRTWVGAK